jgi:uncharacterized protein (TIGR03435 family)
MSRVAGRRGGRQFLATLLAAFLLGCGKPPPQGSRPAPEPDLKLLQAPSASLKSWKDLSGKVVVVEFWATYCVPCVAAIPHFNSLSDAYAGRPVQFLSVTEDGEGPLQDFLLRHPIKGWIGIDAGGALSKAMGLLGIPHTALIDRNGYLVDVLSPEQVDAGVIDSVLLGQRPAGPGAAPAPMTKPDDGLLYIRVSTGTPLRFYASAPGQPYKRLGFPLVAVLGEAYDLPVFRIDAGARGKQLIDVETSFSGRIDGARPLLQAALTTAFRLRPRREKRAMPVYVLSRGPRELRLAHSEPGARAQDWRGSVDAEQELTGLSAKGLTVAGLAAALQDMVLNRAVLDETGVSGAYDFDLRFRAKHPGELDDALARAGFTLKVQTRVIEVLVID